MFALERMVRIRGGIDNFEHNKVLQRVLTWYVVNCSHKFPVLMPAFNRSDILYSSTWNCTPRFPLIQSPTATGPTSTLERFSSTLSQQLLPDYATYMWCISNSGMHHVLEILRRTSTAMPSSTL